MLRLEDQRRFDELGRSDDPNVTGLEWRDVHLTAGALFADRAVAVQRLDFGGDDPSVQDVAAIRPLYAAQIQLVYAQRGIPVDHQSLADLASGDTQREYPIPLGWVKTALAVLVALAAANWIVYPPLVWAHRRRRRRSRKSVLDRSRCPRCRYDTSATPGRCPECGEWLTADGAPPGGTAGSRDS